MSYKDGNYNNIKGILIVGAGPGGLAAAIELKKLFNQEGIKKEIVVIDKANNPGEHNLSGAVMQKKWLFELFPEVKESWDVYKKTGEFTGTAEKDFYLQELFQSEVKIDSTYFLPDKDTSIELPEILKKIAPHLSHKGELLISISKLVKWMTKKARQLGVEVYHGFSAKELIIEDGAVKGVILKESGVDREGMPMVNYVGEEKILAEATLIFDGAAGVLTSQLVKAFDLSKGKNPPVYCVGIKEVWEVPEENYTPNQCLHFFGYPFSIRPSKYVFSGGVLYSMGSNKVAIALMVGLDWKFADLNPQKQLQIFKQHRIISDVLENGRPIGGGAKVIPEGGISTMPKLVAGNSNGLAAIGGDSSNMTNMLTFKGIHLAARSGMEMAHALAECLKAEDLTVESFENSYLTRLQNNVLAELNKSKNARQIFSTAAGVLGAIILTPVQKLIPQIKMELDYRTMKRYKLSAVLRKAANTIDKMTLDSLSGTMHREEEPSHIIRKNEDCFKECKRIFGEIPCVYFCPGGVYEMTKSNGLILNPSNCLHCHTCEIKCPLQAVQFTVPEGGEGPRHKEM